MKKRVSNWRLSIGGVTQCANSTSASSARRRPSRSITARSVVWRVVDAGAILLEPLVIRGAGQRHEVAVRMPGEQDAGFLEQLARGGDVIRDRLAGGRPSSCRAACATPSHHVVVGVAVGGIDAAAGKHVRAAHERGAFVAADHEHFGSGRAVAQHDDGGGGTRVCNDRIGRGGRHRGTILVDGALDLGHGQERADRGAAARLRRDPEVEAEHVGLQARRLRDPRARRADRIAAQAGRHAAEDPEHRPFVDADHPRGAADRDVADHRARDRRERPGRATSSGGAGCAITSSAARRCSPRCATRR